MRGNHSMSTSHTPLKNNSGCLSLLRDPVWQFVFGFLACLISIIGIILALPQAAPIRTGVSETAHQLASGQPLPTPTSTTPVPPLASSETLTENYTFHCSTSCVMPIVITLQAIQVDSKANNMTWTFSGSNNTQYDGYCRFTQFTVQSSFDDQPLTST